jgi:hypothetical protein
MVIPHTRQQYEEERSWQRFQNLRRLNPIDLTNIHYQCTLQAVWVDDETIKIQVISKPVGLFNIAIQTKDGVDSGSDLRTTLAFTIYQLQATIRLHQNETTDLACVEVCNRDRAVSLSSHSSKTMGLPLIGFLLTRQPIRIYMKGIHALKSRIIFNQVLTIAACKWSKNRMTSFD